MFEIILATYNNHKAKEFSEIFGNKIKIKTLKEINFNEKIIENGNSFIENSLIKCKTVYNKIKKPVIADDSGIAVNVLNGKPGIHSARYGNKKFTDEERYLYLLSKLKKADDLTAAFVCALTLYINPNRVYIIQEETRGLITFDPKGKNGFGYDPIFYLPEFSKTAAQLSNKEKNQISHRGKAAKRMKIIIENIN